MADANKKNSNEDLGLGSVVIEENRTRFVNRDGSFNVHRKGVFDRGSFSPYHAILDAPWWRFNLGILIYYLVANFLFAFLYMAAGKNAFPEIAYMDTYHRFGQVFFYSVQVITTLGTSPLHTANFMADLVLAIEAMVGLLGFALGASLFFARFSNPAPGIKFSKKAVISPYLDITGLMIRIINGRSNELINVNATLTLSIIDKDGIRRFHRLNLERNEVLLFPLHWTIVHPIDKESPIFAMTMKDLEDAHAEFLLAISATDQDLSKIIYARMSYLYSEVVMNAKFRKLIERTKRGTVLVDPKRISEIEKA